MADGTSSLTPTTAEVAARPDLAAPERLTRVVALDGPAGTGKSSVARGLARELGWRFVDTGATYRAVTLAVLNAGVDPRDEAAVLDVVQSARVQLVTDPEAPLIRLNGDDVSVLIRSAEVTANVSAVSACQPVRQLLIALQRAAIGRDGAVVEGRDIATVVAPCAQLKVYLDARPEVRALRRSRELTGSAVGGVLEDGAEAVAAVATALSRRDAIDNQTNRLEVSEGAVHLDTSDLSLDQVIATLVTLVRQSESDQSGSDHAGSDQA